MSDCIFCKIAKKETPTKLEWEDDAIMAFNDINPITPVHILIVSKKHIESLGKTNDKDAKMLGNIQKIARELAEKKGIGDAFRLLTLSGKEAGQSVFHLHYHLMGGWKGKAPEIETV